MLGWSYMIVKTVGKEDEKTHCRFQMFQFVDLCQIVLGYLFLLDSCWAEVWKMQTL